MQQQQHQYQSAQQQQQHRYQSAQQQQQQQQQQQHPVSISDLRAPVLAWLRELQQGATPNHQDWILGGQIAQVGGQTLLIGFKNI